GAVEQRVQEMAELVLDGFALQELHVVNHEKVDIAKLFLEVQRIVVADGGGEAPHEIFCRQINDAGLFLALERGGGDCLQEVSLAKTNGSVNEKRIEANGAGTGFGDGAGCGKRHAIRCTIDKAVELIARIAGRT